MSFRSIVDFKNMGIAAKTSLTSSFVVLVLLLSTAGIIFSLESKMISHIIDSFAEKERASAVKTVEKKKLALIKRHQVNTRICAGLSASFVYNFDKDGLSKSLKTFLNLPDILAISVIDVDGNPFAAVWKNKDNIESAEQLDPGAAFDKNLSFTQKLEMDGDTIGTATLYYTDALVNNALADSNKESRESIEIFRKDIAAQAAKDRTIKGLSFAVVVVALVFTIFFTLKILVLKPLHKVTMGLKDIARGEGDLTKRLDFGSKDEVGELAKWFDLFIGKIHGIITDIAQGTEKLNHSSGGLKQFAAQMTVNADRASEKTREVSDRFTQVSQTMDSVAQSMSDVSEKISAVAAATEEMTATISEISENTGKANTATSGAVDHVSMATDQVGELDDAAQQIGKVLETISDISEQVNLLSLNATIEAARAGEAGKGFAVVAGEIKALAGQTSEATNEIKIRVESIQSATGLTIEKIKSISTVVNEVNQVVSTIAAAVEEQSATTQEIAGNVSHISDGVGSANQNVANSSEVLSDIVTQIVQVNETSDNISSESNQVNNSAEDLAQLSRHQSDVVSKFKI